jgi:O-antigen/teichoic acid export membrane protein
VVIGNVSTADYALVAVVIGLQFLLIFLDFGTTAHILDEAGRYAAFKGVARLGVAVGQAWRTIIIGNLIVLIGGSGVAVAGAWGAILGFPDRSSTVSFAIVLTLGINVVARPLSVANSLVAGLGRPTVAQWSQVVASLISLGGATLIVAGRLPLPWLVSTPILGQLVASLIPLIVAMKIAPGLFRASVKAAVRATGHTTNMRRLAAPMLIIQIIGPLNNQLDRVILTHFSTVEAVATFSLATQFYASAITVITALFPTLWVQFAELRVIGGDHLVTERACMYVKRIWVPAIALGIALSFVIWVLARPVSAGKMDLSWTLSLALGATLPVFAIRSILGLALTDAAGLRLQAGLSVLTTSINLALTIVLASRLGALGPVLASLVAVILEGVILAALLRRRRLGTGPLATNSREVGPDN